MTDDVEKVLSEIRAAEGKKKALIDDLLKQQAVQLKELDDKKAAVVKEFAEKLAKLGHRENADGPKRSHKKRKAAAAPGADAAAKTKAKD